jgi:ABC-2 type transport system permease protein
MSRITKTLRLLVVGWWFHLKTLTMSSFFILVAAIQPVIFASIAFFMFRAGGRGDSLLYAALGAGLMGIWSATLFGSGGAIQWQRWEGTLEVMIAAPAPFVLVLLPMTIATSTVGVYSIAATLLWGRLFFGMPFDLVHPVLFAVALPLTVICLGLLGLVLATSFILYRSANAMSNLLEYPVWLVTGLLVPISLLPGWIEPLGWVLAPTWGIRAIRESALGGDPVMEIGMTVLLGVLYLFLGSALLRHFERLSLERATLSLS